MRLRVQTTSPLPHLKAWFVPRPTGAVLSVKTILELKQALCHDVKQLQREGCNHRKIRLLLDDFELLDDLPYDEVLRDGDLVCIHVSEEVGAESEGLKKRKRRASTEGIPKKRQKIVYIDQGDAQKNQKLNVPATISRSSSSSQPSSSSARSSSEEQSDESGSNSSTNSRSVSSEQSTSSELHSSVSPPPASRPSKKLLVGAFTGATAVPVPPPVPPGYGKPSTKSRNLRRRLKRQYTKEAKEIEMKPPQGISDVNLTPLGPVPAGQALTERASESPDADGSHHNQFAMSETRSASVPATFDNSNGETMMGSLRNKNKKKNFRRTMVTPAVRRIVFDDEGNAQPSTTTPATEKTSSIGVAVVSHVEGAETDQGGIRKGSSLVVPPSELAATGLLPSNLFVTSVEFGQQYKKRKRRPRDTYEEEQVDHELQIPNTYQDEDEAAPEEANVNLPYGDEEIGDGGTAMQDSCTQFDWAVAETSWERFPPIQSWDQLHSGVLVCWQGLAINPQTLTPEYLLGVGRVERVSGTTATIRRLVRQGTETATAFGIGDEVEEGEEDYSWNDISGLGWRIANFG